MPANNHTPAQSTVYDREPLISDSTSEEEWSADKYADSNGNRVFPEEDGNKNIRIQLQFPLAEKVSSSHLPKERRKTFIAFGALTLGFVLNSISIALTHQKIPDRTKIPPLPDIFLDNFEKKRWLNDLADILAIVCALGIVVTILLHNYRWIIARRVFVMLGLLYTMRSLTMYATVLPLSNTHVYCSPKGNFSSTWEASIWVAENVAKLIGAGGLPITGKKTLCGDYIYSGHTIIFLMAYLLIKEYSPRKLFYLHWAFGGIAWIGMIGLLISHGHYTIDVIIGYYATTRIFWIYHVMANNPNLKINSHSNFLAEVWWFRIFLYFERHVDGSLPREHSLPWFKKRRVRLH